MAVMATVNGGQQVRYVDHGGRGPVVLLLHAFLMDHDERGHGGTVADGPYDYWDVARDAFGLMTELGIEQAAVVGTSQGGFVGLCMAILAPERVSALAVIGTSAAEQDPQVAAGYRELGRAWAAAGPAAPSQQVRRLAGTPSRRARPTMHSSP